MQLNTVHLSMNFVEAKFLSSKLCAMPNRKPFNLALSILITGATKTYVAFKSYDPHAQTI